MAVDKKGREEESKRAELKAEMGIEPAAWADESNRKR